MQFEPYGSQYDIVSPYALVQYLGSLIGERCRVFQPDYWLDLNAADPSRFADDAYRYGIRYQYAFEHSTSRRLFLMHNDVLVLKDVLGYLGGLMLDERLISSSVSRDRGIFFRVCSFGLPARNLTILFNCQMNSMNRKNPMKQRWWSLA